MTVSGIPSFGISAFGISVFGIPDFGVPGFGISVSEKVPAWVSLLSESLPSESLVSEFPHSESLLSEFREVLHGVGADGVGVKFPIFAVNFCCLPLSFRRRREKRRKTKKCVKKGEKCIEKGKNA